VRAGELRHRVVIQKKPTTVARNGFGEEVIAWQVLATTWARVETLSGGEAIEQARAGATLTHRVTMRYQRNVVPEMRVVWDERTLEIHAVVPDERKRVMALECSEVVE
jgi:SPP1 family predicted phage head-tail adaptor